jgi:hypothetical protein
MQPVTITTEGTTTATWLAAFVRALQNGAVQAGGAGFTAYQLTHNVNDSLIAAGAAFFIALGYRGVVEGARDASRQANGDVKASDVTPNPPAVVVDDPAA